MNVTMTTAENTFKEGISQETKEMLRTFTWEENMNIAFVPLILSYIAWHYADKVLTYCAHYKIQDTKKLTRVIRVVRQRYQDDLRKDLDYNHMKALTSETDRFMKELALDFQILWYSVNNEIKRVMPNVSYDDMRTDAMISMMMIKFLREHNAKMDALIRAKMHKDTNSIENPYIGALYTAMDAYFGSHHLSYNEHMDRWITIFMKHIKGIQFKIV